MWHDIWTNSGRPGSDIIPKIKCSCKLKYKSTVKNAFRDHENEHNDELYEHFLNKKVTEFWKCWSSPFHKSISKEVYINGSNKYVDGFKRLFQLCNYESFSSFITRLLLSSARFIDLRTMQLTLRRNWKLYYQELITTTLEKSACVNL